MKTHRVSLFWPRFGLKTLAQGLLMRHLIAIREHPLSRGTDFMKALNRKNLGIAGAVAAFALGWLSPSAFAAIGFVWGTGPNGVTYCYPADYYGNINPTTDPVDRNYCHNGGYMWSSGPDGRTYCYPTD